ncbi:aminotransferase class V-fold PLP-dependent enzyme [Mycolicibacterium wolinskyi]|uniref:Decarboxylase n=1 Tax=Mycolicibacterium wolinskyi TaxID=59750 RepID=A0A1X2F2P8_9MYCO|nr:MULTISPECIES: DegT/DnrJ/EryC1/StrS family aminotransferase [Mycolicibacterium]MCV7287960.1 aminotransferase class V-fold PLP-dependent enzyme [Mycolicibacterium wolinskyi]MCV7294858.1 aminotransferase class V-fold PLP-dependent enzyme [Mycolicibacterium goodii]ORX12299.1 decarboxylase [Mycolicibacterium wolinskyi]
MNHEAAPLFEALRRFVERDQAPFYSPGHKGGRTLDPWFRDHIAAVDLNNLPDTDTLHCPEGPILAAEELIADAWGVGASFILVQGSTSGNIAMALSALAPGEPVLVQRNAHKSVLAGLVQVGARPVWLEPRWDGGFGVAHGLDADVVERAFAETGAKALWALHPTYYGTTADIEALASLCRRFGARLLVDGAHSPHFAFHPELPVAAERAGASATVQSVHKILSGLSQAAVLHIDPAELDPAAVRRALQLIQTTSPHFAIMASIDLARRQMMVNGRDMLDAALDRARRAATRLAAIDGLRVLRPGDATGAHTGFHGLDETKLLIGTRGLAADARDLVARLNKVHGVQPELSGPGHVLCISTIGNTDADMDRLVAGFTEVAQWSGRSAGPASADDMLIADLLAFRADTVLTPREAFFADAGAVPFSQATDRIAAEAITPYPPGIPLVMPGERLTAEVVDLLTALRAAGNPISASDPELGTVTVVK